MKVTYTRRLLTGLVLGLGSVFTAHSANAIPIYAVTDTGFLISFDSATPGTLVGAVDLQPYNDSRFDIPTAIAHGTGVDYRFEVTTYDNIFVGFEVPLTLGPFSLVSDRESSVGPLVPGSSFGMDFDPLTDQIHMVSDTNSNFMVDAANQNLGVDLPALHYAAGDVSAGDDPNVVSIAYTHAQSPVLYGIDSRNDTLIQIDPTTGEITTVGALGINTTADNGFDIARQDGVAYMTATNSGTSSLYTVNLQTGSATVVADGTRPGGTVNTGIGPGLRIVAMTTVVPEPTSLAMLGLGGLLLARRRRG